MRLLVILFIWSLFQPSESFSNLSSIVSDLSILTRITNAIALQNSAIQKTLKIQDVVAELLKVDAAQFDKLISLDTDKVTDKFQKLSKIASSLAKTPQELLEFSRARYVLAFLKFAIPRTDKFIKDSNYSAKRLISLITADNGLILPCDPSILKTISEFYMIISGKGYALNFVEYRLQNDIRSSIDKIISCFKVFQNPKRARGEMYKRLKSLRSAFSLYNALHYYNGEIDRLKGFSVNLEDMILELKRAEPLVEETEKIGILINQSINANLAMFQDSSPGNSLVGGFPEGLEDLKRVPVDLKSSWFKKKVSRGSVALQKALIPFGRFAKAVGGVQKPWEAVMKDQRDVEKALEGSEALAEIDAFDWNQNPLNSLENSKKAFEKCWKTSGAREVEQKDLDEFKKHLELPMEVYSNMKEVTKQANMVGESSLEGFEKLMGSLEQVIPESFILDVVGNVREDITSHKDFDGWMEVFGKFRELHLSQMTYLASFEKLKANFNFTEDTFLLKPTLDKSNLVTLLNCLETEKFDVLVARNLTGHLENVWILANRGKEVEGFLERLAGLKGVLEEVKMATNGSRSARSPKVGILELKDAQLLAHQLAEGMNMLREMVRASLQRKTLLGPLGYGKSVLRKLRNSEDFHLHDLKKSIPATLEAIDELENVTRTGGLLDIRHVFKDAEKVPGIESFRKTFEEALKILKEDSANPEFQEAMANAQELRKWDLDFAKNKKSLGGAYMAVEKFIDFFDVFFGFKKVIQPQSHVKIVEPSVSYWAVVGMCFGFFALCILVGVIGYGFTKNGRTKYWNTYLYYFPSDKEFEKRWRYSLFMDRENGQNALIDASREINSINVKNILERGAYVNVYSPFGNTALHMATKRGFPKVVELLITNGADRSLVNAQNLIAEQTIPANYRETRKEEADKYAQIEAIYEATRNKKYRIRVPQQMPSHLFHIYIESRTDNSLTNKFTEKYPGITSDEPLPTTTHCICKTSDSGILETDDVDLLAWIFLGVIMVKESWMADCVRDDKMIRRDDKHLIEDVQFHGTLYENCVGQWSQAMAKGTMPYLYGAYFVFVMKDLTRVPTLTMIINTLGGVFLEEFAAKDTFNAGACPYLHTNLGPAFVIHDGQTDLSGYKNDKMYTLFTDTQFIGFLLRRDIHRDTSPNPIPQLAE